MQNLFIAKSWRKIWVIKSLKLLNRSNFSQVMVAEIEYINYFLIFNKHISSYYTDLKILLYRVKLMDFDSYKQQIIFLPFP